MSESAMTLTAREPEDLLAMAPVVLGFVPRDSVVMLTFGARRPFHARVDLPDRPDELPELVSVLLEPARHHGVRRVVLLVYTADADWAEAVTGTLVPAFAAAGIESVADIKARWVDSFFFGSESDDRTVAHAFNDKANPLGVKINAIYSSDVGHWDVPDLTHVLAESWALVEQGVISESDFKAWVFDNPYKLYTEANPNFFKGTAVEEKLKSVARVGVAAE